VSAFLGLEAAPSALTFAQIALRGVIVFVVALVAVRCADRRFLSGKTAFDAVLGFILASMLARAVNGSSAFFPTLGGAFVLVGLHRVVALAARRSHRLGIFVKGRSDVLVRAGRIDARTMVTNRVSHHDLLEDLRLNGNIGSEQDAELAVLERNGQISVVRRERSEGA
jgi:uncharacterized membrane protein YcaP (DUF421 family)